MATLRAAAVAISASATPGATAPMFPDPFAAIPTKASMTPRTVPRSPMSGLTDRMVASDGTQRLNRSRSAVVSESSTSLSASTCETLNRAERSDVPERAGVVSSMKRIARSMITAGGPLLRPPICPAPSPPCAPGRAAKLIPLGEEDPPAYQGEHPQNSEDEFCGASRARDQLHRRARNCLPELQE